MRVFLLSAQVGLSPRQFGPDVTYPELVASGQLRLLSDPNVREQVLGYYLDREGVVEQAITVLPLHKRVARLTGQLPFMLLVDDPAPSPKDRARMLGELENNPDMVADLRELHSDLTMLLFLLDFLEDKAEALIIPLRNPGSG